MRIAHVIDSIDPQFGGPSAGIPSVAAAMAAAGHDVSLICGQAASSLGPKNARPDIPDFENVHVVNLARHGPIRRSMPIWSGRSLESCLANVDVVQLHGIWRPFLAITARFCRRKSIAYSISIHGMLSPWSLQQKKWKKRLALAAVWRRILDEAAFLHCLNSSEAEMIKPLGLRAPVVVVPNGVFCDQYRALPPPTRLAERFPRLRGRRFVLFLGRLHHGKGLDCLVDAFHLIAARCTDVDLVIAGPDAGEGPTVKRQVRNRGLESRVHIVGPLFGEAKVEALAAATLFCLPSRSEGFSLAITEALASGLPVVISHACHFPEVQQAGAGVACDLNAQAIADGMMILLTDEDLRRRAAAAARNLVLTKFDWNGIAQRLVAAYLEYGVNARNSQLRSA